MKIGLFEKMILDFQGSSLHDFIGREHELTLMKDVSVSTTGPRCSGKSHRTYQLVREYLDMGNQMEMICRIQFSNNRPENIGNSSMEMAVRQT